MGHVSHAMSFPLFDHGVSPARCESCHSTSHIQILFDAKLPTHAGCDGRLKEPGPAVCRSLDLLLAIACDNDQALQQMLAAGTMPVILNTIAAYAESVHRASALQLSADSEVGETDDGPHHSNDEVASFVPTPSAVLAALSLCQVRTMVRVSL